MKHLIIAAAVLLTMTLAGCAADPRPMAATAAGHWNFPVVGQLADLSVADLAAAVQATSPSKIYLLRIVNRNKVEAEDTRFRRGTVTYQVIERIHGQWQVTGHITEQG